MDADEDSTDSSSIIRHIKDSTHDLIPICHNLSRFIDTKQFQRLRYIKQLGTTCYVWPGGNHTRFEHSLGVAYLARLMVSHLKKNQPELKITDRDVECVEIAGLCHDLGHGPWSHVWDGIFIPKALPNSTWTHEVGSEMMFDAMVKENEIVISEDDQAFIKALIAGNPSRTPHEKAFLFDVVANKRNGLDVDKFDYIHRDSGRIDYEIRLSLDRLVLSARIIDNQICYNIKDANQIYELCASRFKLHKMIYNHKAAKAIEYMIIDGLLAADPVWHIAERVFDAEEYVWLVDDIMQRIQSSREPKLAAARKIFDRITTRNLYKCVDYKVIDWPFRDLFRKHVTEENIVKAAISLTLPSTPTSERDIDADSTLSAADSVDSLASTIHTPNPASLAVSDVIVDFSTMHYGMKENNPLDSVMFYSKNKPNKCQRAGPGDYSNLKPQHFAEDLLRVYTKKPEFFGLVQAGYRKVLEAMPDNAGLQFDAAPGEVDSAAAGPVNVEETDSTIRDLMGIPPLPAPTPPATEAPSTPKAHSRNASFSFPAGAGSGVLGSAASSIKDTTPFAINSFTTVPPNYAPPSPSRRGRRKGSGGRGKAKVPAGSSGSGKRRREAEGGEPAAADDGAVKKRK